MATTGIPLADGPHLASGIISAPRLLLDVTAAAGSLGISERTVWSLVASGDLIPIRIGRRVLFSLDSLRAWISRQEVATVAARHSAPAPAELSQDQE